MGEEQQGGSPGEDDPGDGAEPGEPRGVAEGAEEDVADDLGALLGAGLGKAEGEGERADEHGEEAEAKAEPSAAREREDFGVRSAIAIAFVGRGGGAVVLVVRHPAYAFFCGRSSRRVQERLWGGCVGAVWAGLVEQSRSEREIAMAQRREVDTEFRLMSITRGLLNTRLASRELRTADGASLVKDVLAHPANGFRSWSNDAGMLVDLWGNPLRIEVGKELGDIKVSSAGRDGTFGTEDDLPREE
jgi:hypothetical protein